MDVLPFLVIADMVSLYWELNLVRELMFSKGSCLWRKFGVLKRVISHTARVLVWIHLTREIENST